MSTPADPHSNASVPAGQEPAPAAVPPAASPVEQSVAEGSRPGHLQLAGHR